MTVIKNIGTHGGFISAPHMDGRMEDEKMMNAGTHLNEPHCSSGLNEEEHRRLHSPLSVRTCKLSNVKELVLYVSNCFMYLLGV